MRNLVRILSGILLLLGTATPSARAQTDAYRTAIEDFRVRYNGAQYEAIYTSFSDAMRKALPLEKTHLFFTGLKAQAGLVKSLEFIQYEQETYAVYKTTFERALLAVHISLDTNHRVNGLFIKPYEEAGTRGGKAVNGLGGYPNATAEAIYTAAKGLPDGCQLSIAVVHGGKTAYYGILKEHDSVKPANNQARVFEIGSLTKVFTATVLASLVVDGTVKLTDAVNARFPFAFKNGVTIRYESLANHTSGLPRLPQNLRLSDPGNPYKDYGPKDLERYLREDLRLEHPAGTYLYSNLGAGLLGYTLGVAQKTTFRNLVQQRIFDTYAMRQSYTSPKGLGNALVRGMDANGTAVPNWDFDALVSAGGILATAADLSKFAAAQFDPANRELALTRVPTAAVDSSLKIGLGWHVLKAKDGSDFVWHNGGTGGYSSSMAVDAARKTAVIILSNVGGANERVDALCFDLLREAAGTK